MFYAPPESSNNNNPSTSKKTENPLLVGIKPCPGAEKIISDKDNNVIVPDDVRKCEVNILRTENPRAFELQVRRDFEFAGIEFDSSNSSHLNALNVPEEF